MAEHAGFCYGVKRAVEMAEQAAASGKRCVMLGSLIHNDSVVRRLESMGLTSVARPEEVPEGATVIIRSHGEPKAVYEALSARGEILREIPLTAGASVPRLTSFGVLARLFRTLCAMSP